MTDVIGSPFFIMDEREKIIKRCAKDLLFFGKLISPKTFYKPSPKFHDEVAEIMMNRDNTQVCIQAPRGFAKSTLAVLFALHHVVFDPGDKVIVIQSKTQPEAINRLTKIKNILNYSRPFIQIFGYAGEEKALQWTEKKIKSSLGKVNFSIKAIGTGMPARGTLESGLVYHEDGTVDLGDDTRITLYYLDDPDDEDNTKTKEAMDYNDNKFAGNKEGLDSRTGRVIVVGTPIREGCIVDRLHGAVGWESRKYQAYWEEDGVLKLLWEEHRDKKWLDDKKEEYREAGRLSKFYSEYMCEIVGDEDKTFKDWKYWDGEIIYEDGQAFLRIVRLNKIDLPEPHLIPVNVFLGIDPASSAKKSADYSVTFPIAYSADKKIYCLPYYRKRVNPTAHAEQIIETVRNMKPMRGQTESVAYQEFLRQYLRVRLDEEGLYLGGLEIKFNPRTEKSARLETLQPFFATGRIYVKEGMRELEDELNMYPRGKHDDLLDGLYYATRKLIPPDHTYEPKKKKEEEPILNWQAR